MRQNWLFFIMEMETASSTIHFRFSSLLSYIDSSYDSQSTFFPPTRVSLSSQCSFRRLLQMPGLCNRVCLFSDTNLVALPSCARPRCFFAETRQRFWANQHRVMTVKASFSSGRRICRGNEMSRAMAVPKMQLPGKRYSRQKRKA